MPKNILPNIAIELKDYRASRGELKKELGAKRDLLFDIYEGSEKRIDEVAKDEYRKMWQNDGQVAAIVTLPQLIINSLGYNIDFEEEKDSDETILEFTRETLKNLSTPVEDIITDMTYAPFEGARFYEQVFELKDSKIVLTKIAIRDNLTVYPAVDDKGDYVGFYQRVDNGTTTIETFIPKNKSVALIFNEAFGGVQGLSMLKAAYYHWDKKHKLYFIAHLASEMQTIPTAIVQHKNTGDAIINEVNQAVEERGLNSRITVPDSVSITELQSTGAPKVDIKELINHHDSKISKSLLTQFIDLGSENSETGSRSLGGSLVDIYYKFIEGLNRKIESAFNEQIIRNLVKLNFGEEAISPKLRFNPIADDDKEFLREIFKELSKKDKIDNKTLVSIVNKVNDDLGIQEVDESLYEDDLDEKAEINQEPSQEDEAVDNSEETINFAETSTRELYPDEKKIDFVKHIEIKDKGKQKLTEAVSTIIRDNINNVRGTIRNVYSSGDIMSLTNLDIAPRNQIIDVFNKGLRDVYESSKLVAANEIEVDATPTDSSQRAMLTLTAQTNVNKLLTDMEARAINIIKTNVANGTDQDETQGAVMQDIIDFIGNGLVSIIDPNINGIFELARRWLFSKNENEIIGYRYTAILDTGTTSYCRSLDGKAFKIDDPDLPNIWPPHHFGERSTMTPILKKDGPVTFEIRTPKTFGSLYDFKDQPAFSESEESTILMSEFDRLIKEIKND